MKFLKFKVAWHDSGCFVFCSDGTRMAFVGKRYFQSEIDNLGSKAAIARLPGALWKRFSV